MHTRNTQSGFALVMSLALVATLLLGVVSFSVIISQSIQQSRLLDDAIQASFSGESGIERSLYHVRQRHAGLDCAGAVCGSDGYCSNNPAQACFTPSSDGLSLGIDWQATVAPENSITITLDRGDSIQVDLFSPLQVATAGITGIHIVSDKKNTSL
jgi:hypothetical protein